MSSAHTAKGREGGASHLVQHDITLLREQDALRVRATVACARRGAQVDVETCGRCAHFARIEPHEAGYLLLCHDCDEPAEAPAPE